MRSASGGFTLIEVIASVMIIGVVIAAMLQLFAHNTRLLSSVERKLGNALEATLLLGTRENGFEDEEVRLDRLLGDFRLDDDLRRRLKALQVQIEYRPLLQLDGSYFLKEAETAADEQGEGVDAQKAAAVFFEIGRTSLRMGEERTSFLRLRM